MRRILLCLAFAMAGCDGSGAVAYHPCTPEAVQVGGHGLYQSGATNQRFRYVGGAHAAELGRDFAAIRAAILDPVHASPMDLTFFVTPDTLTPAPFRSLSISAHFPGTLRVLYDVQPMDPVSRWRRARLPADTRFAAVVVDTAGRALRMTGTMEVLHAWPLDLRFYLVAIQEQPEVVVNGVLTFQVVDSPCPAA